MSVKPVSQLVNPLVLGLNARKLKDYLEKPLIIWDVLLIEQEDHSYYRLLVSESENGEKFCVSTGAAQPMQVIQHLYTHELLPVQVTFRQVGKAILIG
jgi:hypothetical protein